MVVLTRKLSTGGNRIKTIENDFIERTCSSTDLTKIIVCHEQVIVCFGGSIMIKITSYY